MLQPSFDATAIFILVTVGQKNGKYSDHLTELPCENK